MHFAKHSPDHFCVGTCTELSHMILGTDKGENNQIQVTLGDIHNEEATLGDIHNEEAEREKSGLKMESESIQLDKGGGGESKNIT